MNRRRTKQVSLKMPNYYLINLWAKGRREASIAYNWTKTQSYNYIKLISLQVLSHARIRSRSRTKPDSAYLHRFNDNNRFDNQLLMTSNSQLAIWKIFTSRLTSLLLFFWVLIWALNKRSHASVTLFY